MSTRRSRITKKNIAKQPAALRDHPQIRKALGLPEQPRATREPIPGKKMVARKKAAGKTPALEIRNTTLEIWLPGLELYSSNIVLRGHDEIRDGRKRRVRGVQIQNRAKAEAAAAYLRAIDNGAALHAFDVPVDIEVYQFSPCPRIDGPNLWEKSVIDCLSERRGRCGLLGVIVDDANKYVRDRTTGNRVGETGVKIIIRPVAKN